jgi:hypothetical protein
VTAPARCSGPGLAAQQFLDSHTWLVGIVWKTLPFFIWRKRLSAARQAPSGNKDSVFMLPADSFFAEP